MVRTHTCALTHTHTQANKHKVTYSFINLCSLFRIKLITAAESFKSLITLIVCSSNQSLTKVGHI